jgi:hypothetical protein
MPRVVSHRFALDLVGVLEMPIEITQRMVVIWWPYEESYAVIY